MINDALIRFASMKGLIEPVGRFAVFFSIFFITNATVPGFWFVIPLLLLFAWAVMPLVEIFLCFEVDNYETEENQDNVSGTDK